MYSIWWILCFSLALNISGLSMLNSFHSKPWSNPCSNARNLPIYRDKGSLSNAARWTSSMQAQSRRKTRTTPTWSRASAQHTKVSLKEFKVTNSILKTPKQFCDLRFLASCAIYCSLLIPKGTLILLRADVSFGTDLAFAVKQAVAKGQWKTERKHEGMLKER